MECLATGTPEAALLTQAPELGLDRLTRFLYDWRQLAMTIVPAI